MIFSSSVIAKTVIGIAASFLLGWFAIRGLDWKEVVYNLGDVSPVSLAFAISVFILSSWVRALRWRMLLVKHDISVARLFIVQHEGLGISNLMPVRIASELIQTTVLSMRDGVPATTVIATLAVERVLDLVSNTVLLGIMLVLVPQIRSFAPYMFIVVGLTVLAITLMKIFTWGADALRIFRKVPFVSNLGLALREMGRNRMKLLYSLIFSILYWVLVGMSAWIVAVSLDLPLSALNAVLVIMSTIFFSSVVPAAPSAIGTFEFAVVSVLGLFQIDKTDAFGFAVIVHVIFFLPPTIVAAVFLPQEGILSWRMLRRKNYRQILS